MPEAEVVLENAAKQDSATLNDQQRVKKLQAVLEAHRGKRILSPFRISPIRTRLPPPLPIV